MTNTALPAREDSRIAHVGSYVREMAVSVARMYENALDWEHLPYQHASSFSRIECLTVEADAWRARVWNPAPRQSESSVIELRLDRTCRRWITRTLEGRFAGSEIWTHCIPLAESPPRLQVVVDFFVPDVPPEKRADVGSSYASLYRKLYDEDEAMMLGRERALVARRDAQPANGLTRLELGPIATLPSRLPLDVRLGTRRLRVVQQDGALLAYALDCPHLLGPLDDAPVVDGSVTCPWHGYRFALADGVLLARGDETASCRLPIYPVLVDELGVAFVAEGWSASRLG